MVLQDDLNRLQKQLGNFLFPRKCPFCGAVTGGRLDFGTREQIFYFEFDGKRDKRALIKIIGE